MLAIWVKSLSTTDNVTSNSLNVAVLRDTYFTHAGNKRDTLTHRRSCYLLSFTRLGIL